MNLEETMSALGGFTLRVTENFNLAISPKKRAKPKPRAAIKEHKGAIVCELMWAAYLDWYRQEVGEFDRDNIPPQSPAMVEAYIQGDPDAFHEALDGYTVVMQNWDTLQELLDNADGGALVVSGYGLISVGPEKGA